GLRNPRRQTRPHSWPRWKRLQEFRSVFGVRSKLPRRQRIGKRKRPKPKLVRPSASEMETHQLIELTVAPRLSVCAGPPLVCSTNSAVLRLPKCLRCATLGPHPVHKAASGSMEAASATPVPQLGSWDLPCPGG